MRPADELASSCLGDLERWFRDTPAAPAILAPGRPPLTFAALDQRTSQIAQDLSDLGVEPGHIVAFVMPEGPDSLTTILGLMRLTTAAPLDANFTEAELRNRLAIAPADFVLALAGSRAAAVARELALPLIEVSSDPLHGVSFEHDPAIRTATEAPEWRSDGSDTALIFQTSATTSAPKLVPLTHRNVGAICRGVRRSLALTSTDRYLSVMPLHHIVGFSFAIGQLLEGGPVIAAGNFDVLHFTSLLGEFKPTWYAGGPALHRAVFELVKDRPERFANHKLRFIRCGTGAASATLLDQLETALRVPVVNGYGLTELGTITNTLLDRPRKPGSVGRSIGPEIAIADSSGLHLPAGEEGEIVVRGDCVTPGYLNDAAATAEVLRDGWFHTGDLGRLDEDGDLSITGRIKEMINRGGESVAPAEIDHALAEHPAVLHAAAFAATHPTLGEDIAAAVVLRPGAVTTPAEIHRFLSGRLSRARVPSRIHMTESIPVSATGKPLRKSLAERFPADAPHPAGGAIAETLTPVEEKIAALWSSLLATGVPGRNDNFFALGGDSLSAARMIAAVDEEFALGGKLWEKVQFFDSPTVETLAEIVTSLDAAGPATLPAETREPGSCGASAIVLESRGEGAPVFFFPGEGLEPWYLRHLVRHLGAERPFICLRHELSSAQRFSEAADQCVNLIRKMRPEGPFLLAGHCYGGVLAYEAAQRLARNGSGTTVILIDAPTPGYPKLRPSRYLRYIPAAARDLFRAGGRAFLRDLLSHVRFLRRGRYTLSTGAGTGSSASAITPGGVVLRTYRPRPFSGNLACICAGDAAVSQRVLDDARLGWRDFARGAFRIDRVPGLHSSVFDSGNAATLATAIRGILRSK